MFQMRQDDRFFENLDTVVDRYGYASRAVALEDLVSKKLLGEDKLASEVKTLKEQLAVAEANNARDKELFLQTLSFLAAMFCYRSPTSPEYFEKLRITVNEMFINKDFSKMDFGDIIRLLEDAENDGRERVTTQKANQGAQPQNTTATATRSSQPVIYLRDREEIDYEKEWTEDPSQKFKIGRSDTRPYPDKDDIPVSWNDVLEGRVKYVNYDGKEQDYMRIEERFRKDRAERGVNV